MMPESARDLAYGRPSGSNSESHKLSGEVLVNAEIGHVSNQPCAGETFGPEGFPDKYKNTYVFELLHSNGKKLHLCECHIECYWNFWPSFRDAI